MMIGNMMRTGVPPSTFPNPIQRPAVQQTARQTRPVRPMTAHIGASNPPGNQSPGPSGSSGVGGNSGGGQSISDMKMKQRQALLAHTQSFLNPDNKPRVKPKVEVSAKDEKLPVVSMAAEESVTISDGGSDSSKK